MVDACMVKVAARMPKADLDRILAIQDNGFDSVSLSECDFEPGIIRLKLNTLGDTDAFVQAPQASTDAQRVLRIGPNDRL